jgi:hypothetical protein
MHNQDVNTKKANAQRGGKKMQQPPAPVLREQPQAVAEGDTPAGGGLPRMPRRFDEELMSDHDRHLGFAGRLLSNAYETATLISAIGDMVASNGIERDSGRAALSEIQEHHLICAINLMAGSLSKSLCNAADSFEKQLGGQNGGAK